MCGPRGSRHSIVMNPPDTNTMVYLPVGSLKRTSLPVSHVVDILVNGIKYAHCTYDLSRPPAPFVSICPIQVARGPHAPPADCRHGPAHRPWEGVIDRCRSLLCGRIVVRVLGLTLTPPCLGCFVCCYYGKRAASVGDRGDHPAPVTFQ